MKECQTHQSIIKEHNFHFPELFQLTRLGSIPLTWRSCSSIHCVLLTKDVEPSNCFTFVIDAWAGFLFVTEHIKEKTYNYGLNVSGSLYRQLVCWYIFHNVPHKKYTALILTDHHIPFPGKCTEKHIPYHQNYGSMLNKHFATPNWIRFSHYHLMSRVGRTCITPPTSVTFNSQFPASTQQLLSIWHLLHWESKLTKSDNILRKI